MVATSHSPVAAVTIIALGLARNDPLSTALAVGVGLVLHLAQDSIAHTDTCHFRPVNDDRIDHARDRPLRWELPFSAIDVTTGVALSVWAFHLTGSVAILLGCLASIIPDFVYAPVIGKLLIKLPGAAWYTKIHEAIHFPLRPSQKLWGILPQVLAIVLPVIWLAKNY